MIKYEYLRESKSITDKRMCELGAKGWRLVMTTPHENYYEFIFERVIVDQSAKA